MIDDFWRVTKRVFTFDFAVFEELKGERFWNAVVYFALFTVFFVLVSTEYYLDRLTSVVERVDVVEGVVVPDSMGFIVLFAMVLFGVLFSFTFVKYYVVHVLLSLFVDEASYEDTYKALAYSVGPGYVAMPFFLLAVLSYSFLDTVWVWPFFVVFVGLFLFFEGYNIYLRCKALDSFYDIGVWKAFLILFVLAFIVWNVVLAVVMFLLFAVLFLFI